MKHLFNSSNPVIGIIFPVLWSGHYVSSLQGFIDAASKLHCNLLFFQGSYFHNCYTHSGQFPIERAGNILFDIARDIHLDGLILHTYSVRSFRHKTKVLKLCRETFTVPIVNVGSALEGVTNVQVDNECGIRELLNHLIITHNYTKFGFIRGPQESNDARMRYHTFLDVLSERQIPADPDLISEPLFWSFDNGKVGVRKILSKPGKKVDVIICASDLLATGVLDELSNRGIVVPDEVGVVGFNDNNYADICFPPLTTVNLMMYQRCMKAVEILVDTFSGKELPDNVFIPSVPVIRRSCGCQFLGVKSVQNNFNIIFNDLKNISFNSQLQDKLVNEIYSIVQCSQELLPIQIVSSFVDVYFKQCKNSSVPDFLQLFSEMLHRTVQLKYTYKHWHAVLDLLEKRLPDYCSEQNLPKVVHSILQARIMISQLSEINYRSKQTASEEFSIRINFLNYGFYKANHLKDIIQFMGDELPAIGISSCYLSLYENMQQPLQNARCVLAFSQSGRIDLPENGITFPTKEILPETIAFDNNSLMIILEPLFYDTDQLGFMLLELESIDQALYSIFPSQLSAALWSSILCTKEQQSRQALREQAERLESTNVELTKWTSQLEKALLQLQENHERLLSSEKMASLGRFTAGITHEMNTPLATLRATLDEMKRLYTEYKESINDPSVSVGDHREIAQEFENSLKLAQTAIEKSTDFIVSIKAQTRDIKGEEKHLFDLNDIIHGVIVFLGFSLQKGNCKVELKGMDKPYKFYGSPTRMTQVLTNLISNAIDAMESGGKIEITVGSISEEITSIIVKDTGTGIAPEHIEKIFEPLFTTKSFGMGTGLGLSIVHDIITLQFGGTIEVQSQSGIGTSFTITLQNKMKEYVNNGKKI